MRRSPTFQLIDRHFGDLSGGDQDFENIVAHQRYQGRSWRYISGYVFSQTGILVSHETLRSWFPDA